MFCFGIIVVEGRYLLTLEYIRKEHCVGVKMSPTTQMCLIKRPGLSIGQCPNVRSVYLRFKYCGVLNSLEQKFFPHQDSKYEIPPAPWDDDP